VIVKIELVGHWRDWWRMWSVRLSFVGTALLIFFQEAPQHATTIWLSFPADIKAVLPEDFVRYFGYGLIAASWVAQFIRQNKLVERAKARLGWPSKRDAGILPSGDSDVRPTADGQQLDDGLHGIRDGAEDAVPAERAQPSGQ